MLDYKKINAPMNTQTRDVIAMSQQTGNVYEMVAVIAQRANQIGAEIKQDLTSRLQEFQAMGDTLEEVSENREQIEISKFYEKLPKPTLIATQEYLDHKIFFKNPAKDKVSFD